MRVCEYKTFEKKVKKKKRKVYKIIAYKKLVRELRKSDESNRKNGWWLSNLCTLYWAQI